MANLIIFFAFVFGRTGLAGYLSENDKLALSQDINTFFYNRSDIEIVMVVMIPLALVLICSFFVSLTFYRNREF